MYNLNTINFHNTEELKVIFTNILYNSGGSFIYKKPKRYIISLQSYTVKVPLIDFNIAYLLEFIKRYEPIIKYIDGGSLGCWIDDSIVHLDINLSNNYLSYALDIAKINSQLAIYDSIEGKSIYINDIDKL